MAGEVDGNRLVAIDVLAGLDFSIFVASSMLVADFTVTSPSMPAVRIITGQGIVSLPSLLER